MNDGQVISINFLSISNQDFNFRVYRIPYSKNEFDLDKKIIKRFSLPKESHKGENQNYSDYYVSFNELGNKGEEFLCNPQTNIYLTKEYLYQILKKKATEEFKENVFEKNENIKLLRLFFTIYNFPEGKQCIWLEPYYLSIEKKFGFLVDFKFVRNLEGVINSKKVQQLSLSLKNDGRSNLDFYIDRYEFFNIFRKRFFPDLFPIDDDSTNIQVEQDFYELNSKTLKLKKYIFKNRSENTSQFSGLKINGPYKTIEKPIKIYFIYREIDNITNKQYSYDLYNALIGKSYSSTFPGMEKMFKVALNKNNIVGKSIRDFSIDEYKRITNEIIDETNHYTIVPILITPFSKDDFSDEASKQYYLLKHIFLEKQLTSQFVSEKRIKNKDQVKWAISNIALQLFAKLGGQPWIVKPQTEKCLIVGIGQSHKKNSDGSISKYYAYSILTDSSGLYKEIKVLSESNDKNEYLSGFKRNLMNIIKDYICEFDEFVLHTTFSIKRNELEIIKEVLEGISLGNEQKIFSVMTINEKNKYFGYSLGSNSLIPYESTYIKISKDEYLVWFEGLQFHNPVVRKRIGRPVYIKFLFSSKILNDEKKKDYLQDAINLSGANWRGFNAKSIPISIYYAQIVAKYFKEFLNYGLDYINLENITPWFL